MLSIVGAILVGNSWLIEHKIMMIPIKNNIIRQTSVQRLPMGLDGAIF